MKISVVITTKNRDSLFNQALQSVLNQTVLPAEVIIIDDGSDKRKDIAINPTFSIQYYFNIVSVGVAASRNQGIEQSIGDVIFFLDDDDVWLENHIESHYLEHKKGNILLCYSQKNIFLNDCNNIIRTTKARSVNSVNIFDANFIGTPSGVSISKDAFNYINKFDTNLKALEDYDLWLRFVQYFGNSSVICLDKITLNYRVSKSSSNVSHNMHNHIDAMKYILKNNSNIINDKDLKKLKKYLTFCVLKTIHRISYVKMFQFYLNNVVFSKKIILLIIPYKVMNFFGIYST